MISDKSPVGVSSCGTAELRWIYLQAFGCSVLVPVAFAQLQRSRIECEHPAAQLSSLQRFAAAAESDTDSTRRVRQKTQKKWDETARY